MLRLQANTLKDVRHGFFGRTGGVSEGVFASLNCGPGSGDDRAAVVTNRLRIAQALGDDVALVNAGQIHGTTVVTVSCPWPIGETPADDPKYIPLGDAMVTRNPGIALGILTADCAPVLFADTEAQVIGAAHAGWKGALAGVTDSTIAAMEKLGARRERIVAAIGPCISLANYEVDDAFRTHFLDADKNNARFFEDGSRADHRQFDLPAYVTHRLTSTGLAGVEDLAICTYARSADFFSFRRTTHRGEKDYGRQISAIVLR
jgi:polyphenol oxidase